MRLLAIVLAAFIVLLQWPLWVGKGSWLKVWQIQHDVEMQKAKNTKLTARNAALDAEVRDLKTGTDAIEERARNELGMVRQDEVFYQILDPHAQGGTLTAPVAAAPSTLNGAATAPTTGAASPAPSADHSVKP